MEKLKVLIVEDEDVARKQLARAISKEGFEVIKAENGRIGIEKFEKESPDIIISDLKMPDIGGIKMMHTIKKASPNTQIILVTAFGEVDTAIMALREGALDYIKKPIDLDILLLSLGRAKEKIIKSKKIVTIPTVLLTDDDDGIRQRLARELEKENLRVFQAKNGEEAIGIFKKEKIDIVLLDIKMPTMDGLTALSHIRKLSDDFEAIILSGYGDEQNAITALRNGAINFIKKPIDLDQLIISIEKALEKLNSDRSLKYRIHELELANDIITRITDLKEIVVNVNEKEESIAKEFALNLIDAVPLEIVMFSEDLKISYINQILSQKISNQSRVIDEDFLNDLNKMGINIEYKVIKSAIRDIIDQNEQIITKVSTGEYSYLTLTSLSLIKDNIKTKMILMILRGERLIGN